MKVASDASMQTIPHLAPGDPRPAGHEETAYQNQHGEQVHPIAHHVEVRKPHVARPAHQGNEVVAETAEKQRGQQVDDHDHPVQGDELVVILRRDQRKAVRKAELQPHQNRQRERDQADGDRRDRVLNRDDLMVLRPDVSGQEALRLMERMSVIAVGNCSIGHRASPHSESICLTTSLIACSSVSDLAMAAICAPLKSCG